jgi:threonine/homoserine/homoserine lactone efflux protein
MTIEATIAFFFAFLLLALMPGAGLAVILSRALSSGILAGFAVTSGLIVGDFIFMGIALIGLSTIAQTMGPVFQIVKYCGAIYLIWLGLSAFLVSSKSIEIKPMTPQNLLKDGAMGLFVTLGNPKPILFYGSLLPTFLDLSVVKVSDYILMSFIVALVSFAVYGGYMIVTLRAKKLLISSNALKRLDQATGVMFIGSGVWVASR